MSKLKKFTSSKVVQLLAIWVILYAVFTVVTLAKGTTVKFLSAKNFFEIVDLMILSSFLAVGSGFLLCAGHMDLSAASIGAFANVMFASLMDYHNVPVLPAIIIAMACAICFGLINALLVNEFHCPTFIVTMSMTFVAKGMMQLVSVDPSTGNAGTVNFYNDFTTWVCNTKIAGVVSIMFVIVVVMFIFYGLLLAKTKFGMQVYLVGSNPMAATLCGINAKKVLYILFGNSAMLASLAGMIYMCRASQGDLNALASNQFTGMTAAILGGVSFGGGNGNLAGVFVGLLILNTFSKGMVAIGSSSYWTTILTGVLLLVALIIDSFAMQKARKAVK